MKKLSIIIAMLFVFTLTLPSFAVSEEELLSFVKDSGAYTELLQAGNRSLYDPNSKTIDINHWAGTLYAGVGDYTTYEGFKNKLLSVFTPYLAEVYLSYGVYYNINGALYQPELLGAVEEGGLYIDAVTLYGTENGRLFVTASNTLAGWDYDVELCETEDGLRLDYISVGEICGRKSSERTDENMRELFTAYLNAIVQSYAYSENITVDYEKYLPDSVEITIDSFDGSTCGSGSAVLTEYNQSGIAVAKHRIDITVDKNLSESIADTVISKYASTNPMTSDFSMFPLLCFAAAVTWFCVRKHDHIMRIIGK